ncbi:MAG: methyltransferase [Lachnospiraceae bacterium]|nr:methyltransferase [Lachnospiraceae bacterium]
MSYVIVEVYLPAAGKSYDIKIPRCSQMWEVCKLVGQALEELSDGLYKATEDLVLCHRATGTIFNINYSVEELGIMNGSQLILI